MEHAELEGGLKATVDVPVEAEAAGAAGNVEAKTILAIEGDLGLLVTVTNAEPTTGGRDRLREAATERDLARLRKDLLEELEKQALEEMETMLGPGRPDFRRHLGNGAGIGRKLRTSTRAAWPQGYLVHARRVHSFLCCRRRLERISQRGAKCITNRRICR